MLDAANPNELGAMLNGPVQTGETPQAGDLLAETKAQFSPQGPKESANHYQVLVWRSVWDLGD